MRVFDLNVFRQHDQIYVSLNTSICKCEGMDETDYKSNCGVVYESELGVGTTGSSPSQIKTIEQQSILPPKTPTAMSQASSIDCPYHCLQCQQKYHR